MHPGGQAAARLRHSLADGLWIPYYDPRLDPIRRVALQHAQTYVVVERAAWVAAVFFIVADLITTLLGLSHPLLAEGSPHSQVALQFGWVGMIAKTMVVIGAVAGLWAILPRPYRLVVPLTAAIAGTLPFVNNLVLLVEHGVIAIPG